MGAAHQNVTDVLCPVVVGREAEMRMLEESLSAAAGGRGACVFIIGEAGIGQLRLAREVCALAQMPMVWGPVHPG